ncbi:MAG: Mut7-C RNAse domain-containing protein [Pseudomonadota bacterium]
MVTAQFRFYEELNDFLAPARRGRSFSCACARAATVKHMVEALGVPHTEVELVLVNGASVGFEHRLGDGDRVAVYPKFETFDISALLRLRARPLRSLRFVADVHLGGLARLLRMAGFDTIWERQLDDAYIASLSLASGRIVLTRDRDLLKRRCITHGCYLHALKPAQQFRELAERLDLAASARPFTLCLECNTVLHPVDKAEVAGQLPPAVREHHTEFQTCDGCHRVFWKGRHWQHMQAMLAATGMLRSSALQHRQCSD